MKCRACSTPLTTIFADLGFAPPSNSYLNADQLNEPEVYYPLKTMVCDTCWLVQVDEVKKSSEIFSEDYAYFSSCSKSWLEHAKHYVEQISRRLDLNEQSQVVEIASNDGYLLQYFVERKIPCLGVEPTASTAKAAREKGIETIEEFFGLACAQKLVEQRGHADLVVGNNVLAHVPDIRDFVAGIAQLLKPEGTVTLEFPHLLNLIKYKQFDTIYHEHFSYLSLTTLVGLFSQLGLTIHDVEKLPTHGGSLRIFASRSEAVDSVSQSVDNLLKEEQDFGLSAVATYSRFQLSVDQVKNDFLGFLLDCKRDGKQVVAYGAAAKGNTLLNYAGIKHDLIDYVVDVNRHKAGKYLPGSHIPILDPARIFETRPDYVVVLPWNLLDELMQQLADIKSWGGKLVVAVPELKVIEP